MKKFFFPILLIAITINISPLPAQQKYLPKEGLQAALDYAVSRSIMNPKIVCLGTMPGTNNIGGIPVNIQYDWTNGKANVWLYVIRSGDSAELNIGVVLIKFVTFIPFEYTDLQTIYYYIPIDPYITFHDNNWIDSDKMLDTLKKSNPDFIKYINDNQDTCQVFIGLFINSKSDMLPANQPFWGTSIIKGNSERMCAVHAYNYTTYCYDSPDAVDDNEIAGQVKVFPNPADENININISGNIINGTIRILLVDLLGNTVAEKKISDVANSTVTIPTAGLSQGVYFLKVENNYTYKVFPVIVNH